ncbi:MAG: LTA synthase family protein [Nitrosomonadales bacterium]|nr:LTA synthase family protein [Nitrosomonadales bacterium]
MWIVAYVLLHLAVYSVFRLQFLIWNWNSLQFDSTYDILRGFGHGLRFDLSAVAATSVLFLMALYWIVRFRIPKLIWFGAFWLLNVVLFIINCADAELVNFTARRFTKASLFLLGEGQNLNVIGAYLGIALFGLAVIGLYSYATYVLYQKITLRIPVYRKMALTLLTLLVAAVFFRGGFQSKPIMPVDGRLFTDPMANHMVLNSTFTLLKSLDKPTVERVHYFATSEMLGYLNRPDAFPAITPPLPKANVVVIVLESFSKEYTELRNPEFTPFLNRLAKQGAYFPHFYANSKSSIAGIPAILAGVPALMDDPFIDSEFSLNHYTGIASVLAKQGYHTSFFHGANKNSMHFDAFAPGAGFQHHYARTDFPDKQGDDGKWGIYDGPFLNWICEQYSAFPEPFMSSVFTLSSHQPYSVPPAERDRHPDGSHPILKSIHYTDASLEQFMKCASGKKWFQNTLFVFTADHAGPALRPNAFAKQFEVPLVIYAANPEVLKGMDTGQYAQQIDLLPTILETVGVSQNAVNHLARSLWHPGQKVIPLYLDGTFQLEGLPGGISDQLRENTQKAVWQYFSEGMLDDRLYIQSKH